MRQFLNNSQGLSSSWYLYRVSVCRRRSNRRSNRSRGVANHSPYRPLEKGIPILIIKALHYAAETPEKPHGGLFPKGHKTRPTWLPDRKHSAEFQQWPRGAFRRRQSKPNPKPTQIFQQIWNILYTLDYDRIGKMIQGIFLS